MGGTKAHTTDPTAVREQMLQDMPIEQMEEMMQTSMSRSDEMWNRSREALDPDSEMNQRQKANIMGQNQDMIATQMRMQQGLAKQWGHFDQRGDTLGLVLVLQQLNQRQLGYRDSNKD